MQWLGGVGYGNSIDIFYLRRLYEIWMGGGGAVVSMATVGHGGVDGGVGVSPGAAGAALGDVWAGMEWGGVAGVGGVVFGVSLGDVGAGECGFGGAVFAGAGVAAGVVPVHSVDAAGLWGDWGGGGFGNAFDGDNGLDICGLGRCGTGDQSAAGWETTVGLFQCGGHHAGFVPIFGVPVAAITGGETGG